MAKVVQITAENFEEEVIKASETRAVAILFSSAEYPDCAPYSQLVGQLSTSMDFTLGVVSCDDRENMRLIQMFRVQSVPEIHVVDKGQIADVIQGVLPEADLKKRLEKFYVSEEARFQTALEDRYRKGKRHSLQVCRKRRPVPRSQIAFGTSRLPRRSCQEGCPR